jgi:hypothetical protein
MQDITLTLTVAEAQQLVTLIDAAVRANGLQAAHIALPIAAKVIAASQPQQ